MNSHISIIKSIATCLTLEFQPGRKKELQALFSSPDFPWDYWIKTASDQYVLPAVYLQLERAGLLSVFPADWLEHLSHLVEKNSERNHRILEEVKIISSHLLQKGIEAVFLKGTAHLLLGLYTNPAERMIGDIDFLVKEEDIFPAVDVLLDLGFHTLIEYKEEIHSEQKHYPRLVNYDYEASVEVHRSVVLSPYNKAFSSSRILMNKQEVAGMPGVFVPSNQHLIVHNMMNAQFNDKAYSKRMILLRQMYDLLNLSKLEDPYKALLDFGSYKKQANAMLAVGSELFNLPDQISFNHSRGVRRYLKSLHWFQNHPRILRFYLVLGFFVHRIWRYISFPVQAIFDRRSREGLRARLIDLQWYKNHVNHYVYFFRPEKRFKK